MKPSFIMLALVLFPIALAAVEPETSPGRLKQSLLRTVLKVEAFAQGAVQATATGTGFLVSLELSESKTKSRATFLVTNKHMLGDWNIVDANITHYHEALKVYFYGTNGAGDKIVIPTKIALTDALGQLRADRVQMHDDPHVDVAVVLLTQADLPDKNIELMSYDESYLLDFPGIGPMSTGLGDQVFALGYPLGITSLNNNYPIAKAGYIASVPGEEVALDFPATDRAGNPKRAKFGGKILLIDGLLVPGNSGGPVVLTAETKVRVNPETKQFEFTRQETKNLVIGVVSAGLGPSGLTVVFSSSYIKEAIKSCLNKLREQSK